MAGVGAIRVALSRSSSPSPICSGGSPSTSSPPNWRLSRGEPGAGGSIRSWTLLPGGFRSGAFSSASTSRPDFWILPPNIANALDKALYVIAAASLTFLASEVLVKLVRTHGPTIDPALPTTTLTENLVRIVVVILGLLVILGRARACQITPILTALGVGGLAVALALQDTLANSVCGLLPDRRQTHPHRQLHQAVVGRGRLSRRHRLAREPAAAACRTTPCWCRTPSSRSRSSPTTTLPDHELVVTIEASVDYASDLDRVERIATEVARDVMRTVPGGVPGFDPLVRFHTFGDPGIGFSVILRAQEFVDQYLIKHEFVKRLHKRFLAEGITIPIKSLVQRHDAPPPPP